MKTPFVNIHTHNINNIDNEGFIEIRNINIDNDVNVDVSSFYSIGMHPWDIMTHNLEEYQEFIKRNLNDKKLLALGECGLDRAISTDFERQKRIFIKHIEMSEQYRKPLIIHAVRTYPDIIATRKETKATMPWIIHGFQGNEQSVEQLLRHEIYFSLGDVLFKNPDKTKRLLNIIPKERLFLETDDSKTDIIEMYDKTTSLISVDIDELKTIIFNNFIKVFGDIWNGIQGHNC